MLGMLGTKLVSIWYPLGTNWVFGGYLVGMLGMLGIQWVFGTHQIPTEYPLAMLGMLGMLVTNVYYVTYTHWVLIFNSPTALLQHHHRTTTVTVVVLI